MPELPDITVYLEALEARIAGQKLERVRLANPFLLRTVDPPIKEAEGRMVIGLRRLGKRIVIALEPDLFLVLHLMIAGRLHWKKPADARTTRSSAPSPIRACSAASATPTRTRFFTALASRRWP